LLFKQQIVVGVDLELFESQLRSHHLTIESDIR